MDIQWDNVFRTIVMVFHLISDWFLEMLLSSLLGVKHNVSSPIKSDTHILFQSATDLALQIRSGELESFEVVKAYYNRITLVNRELNAIVDGPFFEALEEAKAIDSRLKNGEISKDELELKPFLGVPFSVKDNIAVTGKLHTLGLVSRKNERASEDAEVVRLMKESGAIILATTNIPELCKWVETRNMLVGQTNNPYDFRRSVGGSSGGEAALISACCIPFGVGTDVGGSIRIPAFNCGIFGHKPTTGVVDTRGCNKRQGNEPTMVAVGPMTRCAKDLMPMLKVLVEPKFVDTLRLNEEVDLKTLRYFYIPQNDMMSCNPVSQEMQRVMFKVRQHFSKLKCQEVELAELPHLELTAKMWRYWMTQESSDFKAALGNGANISPLLEVFKKMLGQSEFTLASIYSLIDSMLPQEQEQLMRDVTDQSKTAFAELLGNDGVLFFHSSPRFAPFHYYPLLKVMDFTYTSIFNVLQVPVTQVPMGLNKKGIPLGIQVVAAEQNDRLCIAVAEELERAFGGWVPPFHGCSK